jgi:hypothetical protein
VDEATWRTTRNPTQMVEYVRRKASKRKLSLYGCACIRQTWGLLPADCRDAVEITERCAEGTLPQSELGRRRRLLESADRTKPDSPSVRAVVLLPLLETFSSEDWRPLCSLAMQCDLAQCVFGNPFRPVPQAPAWACSETARQMAQAITDEGRYADLPILADALEDAGCADEDVLGHCRGGVVHARGCWVIDLILGRE